ncbi:MAG: hypothetical protein GF398_18485 [Chitinivibrionales bacterium]|nr:hypothetical protein [Chitinivibrionales bacterium]
MQKLTIAVFLTLALTSAPFAQNGKQSAAADTSATPKQTINTTKDSSQKNHKTQLPTNIVNPPKTNWSKIKDLFM